MISFLRATRSALPAAAPLSVALASVALAGVALAGVARAQTTPVLPGYWESTERYSVLLSGGGHSRKCLTPERIESFVASPSNSHYHCTYASRDTSGGQAAYRGGACFDKRGRKVLSNVSVDGRYEPEAFHLTFRFTLVVTPAGGGLPGSAVIDAHRVAAECPADVPPGK